MIKDLPISYIRKNFEYDEKSGMLLRGGAVDGRIVHRGKSRVPYIVVSFDGMRFYAHRVAWTIFYGESPSGHIDHIDGNTLNNRINNLRVVPQSENNKNRAIPINNKSGVIGVHLDKERSLWKAQISKNGRLINLGRFNNLFDACCSRKSAELQLGYHVNHGRNQVSPDQSLEFS